MNEYEVEFCKRLHAKLKEKIYAGFFVKIYDDVLVIKIAREGNLECEICIEDITNKILNGYSTDYACYEVVTQYRKIILSRYFK